MGTQQSELIPVIVIVRPSAFDVGNGATGMADASTIHQVRDEILAAVFGEDGVVRGPDRGDPQDERPRLRDTFEVSRGFSMLISEADAERLTSHSDVERVIVDQAQKSSEN